MERKEAYEQIKELNLQEECKKKYGKNFTQCKTDELIHLIQSFIIKEKQSNEAAKGTCFSADIKKETNEVESKSLEDRFIKLVKFLQFRHILLGSEVRRILG